MSVQAVPSNYMSYIDTDYYYPSEDQSGIKYNKTGGFDDPVQLLYSTEGTTPPTTNDTDPYNIVTTTNAQNLSDNQNYTS